MQKTLQVIRALPTITKLMRRPFAYLVVNPQITSNPALCAVPDFFDFIDYVEKKTPFMIEQNQKRKVEKIFNTILNSEKLEFNSQDLISVNDVKDCLSEILNKKISDMLIEEQKKITLGVAKLYQNAVRDTGCKVEIGILKNFLTLCYSNIMSPLDLFNTIQGIATTSSNFKSFSIEDTAIIMLLLHDLLTFPKMKKVFVNEKENLIFILSRIQHNLEYIFDTDPYTGSEYAFYLPKILFCYSRLGYQDVTFLNRLLRKIQCCDFQNIEEKDLLNIFYVVIFIEKRMKFFSAHEKLSENYNELFKLLDSLVVSKILSNKLSISSMPFVVFCYSLSNRPANNSTKEIFKIIIDNINKFEVADVSTILYSLSKIHDVDPGNEFLALIISMYFNSERIERLLGSNLFAALLGIRKALQESRNPKHKLLFQNFMKLLFKQFKENFDLIDKENKLRIMYEFALVHRNVDKEFYETFFKPYILNLDMENLNTQDLLTIGSLQRKFMTFTPESYQFWVKYLNILSKTNFEREVESKRAFSLVKNLLTMIEWGEAEKLSAKDKTDWYNTIHSYYKKYL